MTAKPVLQFRTILTARYLRYLSVLAAIPAAILAFIEGFRIIRSVFLDVGQSTPFYKEELYEGTLLIVLSVSMALIGIALYQKIRHLEFQQQLAVDGNTKISFQLDAMKLHSIISEVDPDGRFRNVNENWEKLFEYTRSEIMGRHASILFEDDQHDKRYLELRETLKRGQVFSGEQKLITKSGKIVVVQSTVVPMFDSEGNHLRTITMRTDITASKLIEADHFLTALLNELQEEVYIYDLYNYNIIYMNHLALESREWTLEESKTKNILHCAFLFDVSAFSHHIKPLLDGAEKAVKIQVKRKKGYVEVKTRIHRQIDNTPVLVSTLRDITAEKLALKRQMQSVASISHELRAPLTSIKGSLRLLNSGVAGDLDGNMSKLVDIADRNTDRMLSVLNEILDFEKIVANKIEFDLELVNLTDFVRDAVEINKGYAVEYNVNFVTGALAGQTWVTGDRCRLMQVITNLMSNAAKFSPPGEDVVISVADQGNAWRVSVADLGPGIPTQSRDKVFEIFAQLDPADGKPRNGTGLGLAISRKIIEVHTGTLNFDSVVGEGAIFYFDLPKADTPDKQQNEIILMAAG